jgi:hypothetical protein
LQSYPISSSSPTNNQVLEYSTTANSYVPSSISSSILPNPLVIGTLQVNNIQDQSNGIILTTTGTNPLSISNTTQALSNTTGALICAGGISTQANLYVGGNENITGTLIVNSTTDSTSASTGSINTAGGIGVAKSVYIGGSTAATSTSTGALQVPNGGISCNSAVWFAQLNVNAGAQIGGSIYGSSLNTTATADTTSIGTGTVVNTGGQSIAKNCYIGGNEVLTGTLTVNSSTDSSSTSTGSIICSGGLGVAKTIYSGTGIYLPTASGTATLLSYYERTSFTSTITQGSYTSGSLTFNVIRIGSIIFILYPALNYTSTQTAIISTNTAVPTRFLPSADNSLPGTIYTGSAFISTRLAIVAATGIISISSATNGTISSTNIQMTSLTICYNI